MKHAIPIVSPTSSALQEAAARLRDGKLVAFPTETVYGLGGDATNDRTIAAIYEAKGRPQFNPLIAHIADLSSLKDMVIWNDKAQRVTEKFWPGPLTLVLPRAPKCPVSLLVSAGLDTLAIRMPNHPIALELIRATGRPIAAPSANASGRISPTLPEHVAESLGDKVDLILDGGKCEVGVESTVLDLTTSTPTILRPGGITGEQLVEVLGKVKIAEHDNPASPKSPGMLASHYAPSLKVRLNATEAGPTEALLTFGPDASVKGGAKRLNLSSQGNLTEAAANLFAMLRELDNAQFTGIAVMPIPMQGLGVAINDRLRRASGER